MHRVLKGILVLAALVAAPAAVFAQASIVGVARDASGAVLPGVTVEASSPALIEKVRTVVSNGVGQYSIEDLRPGTYTVTFSLSGFTTVKREGIQLSGSFVATVNGEMRVGGVTETITVSGEAPVVDVTSTRNQQVISSQTIGDIPTSRNYSSFTQLVPALNVQQNDFEGSNPALYSVFQIHGGRRNEGQVLVDGMNGGYQGMGVSGYVPEVGNSQEVVVTLSGGLGEATTGGPQMNIVTKQGGNTFAGSFFISGTGDALQGSNIEGSGLTATNSMKKLWELNPSFGGPIVRDKLWFFGTFRYQNSLQNVASMWANLNAGDPTKWTYLPADGQNGRPLDQAATDGYWKQTNARVTWQVTPRNKVSFWNSVQYHCIACDGGGDGTGLGFGASVRSPEAYTTNENHPSMMTQVSWTSPVEQPPAARGQRAARGVFLVGQPSEECVRHDDDPGARDGRPDSQPQLPRRELVRPQGLHEHRPGIRVVRHRVALGEGGLPPPPEHRDVPDQLLQQHAAQLRLHERRSRPR